MAGRDARWGRFLSRARSFHHQKRPRRAKPRTTLHEQLEPRHMLAAEWSGSLDDIPPRVDLVSSQIRSPSDVYSGFDLATEVLPDGSATVVLAAQPDTLLEDYRRVVIPLVLSEDQQATERQDIFVVPIPSWQTVWVHADQSRFARERLAEHVALGSQGFTDLVRGQLRDQGSQLDEPSEGELAGSLEAVSRAALDFLNIGPRQEDDPQRLFADAEPLADLLTEHTAKVPLSVNTDLMGPLGLVLRDIARSVGLEQDPLAAGQLAKVREVSQQYSLPLWTGWEPDQPAGSAHRIYPGEDQYLTLE